MDRDEGKTSSSQNATRGESESSELDRGHLIGVQEFRSSGVQEFRSSGVQEFRSSGVQEFRSSGVQDDLPGKNKPESQTPTFPIL
jgi:hypothetical protein